MAFSFRSSCAFVAAAVLCSSAAPATEQCDLGDDDIEEFRTDLIQQQRKFLPRSAKVDGLPPQVYWVHVPRTGASFQYTLLTMREICGKHRIPDDRDLAVLKVHFVQKHCFGLLVDGRCKQNMNYGECSEASIGGPQFLKYSGSLVGFFRQPEIRLLSDYYHGNDGREFSDWAIAYIGCFTKKLTWTAEGLADDDWHCKGDAPTWDEVDLAVKRVRDDYIFIGLTDDWNLSICLFNKMFGNTPRAVQFQNYGAHSSNSSGYDESEFDGFTDPYDTPVWETAEKIFRDNLERYDVTEERCEVPSE